MDQRPSLEANSRLASGVFSHFHYRIHKRPHIPRSSVTFPNLVRSC